MVYCVIRWEDCRVERDVASLLEWTWFMIRLFYSWMNPLPAWTAHPLCMLCRSSLKWLSSANELFSWPSTNLATVFLPQLTSFWCWRRAMSFTTARSRGWSLISTALNVACQHMWVIISDTLFHHLVFWLLSTCLQQISASSGIFTEMDWQELVPDDEVVKIYVDFAGERGRIRTRSYWGGAGLSQWASAPCGIPSEHHMYSAHRITDQSDLAKIIALIIRLRQFLYQILLHSKKAQSFTKPVAQIWLSVCRGRHTQLRRTERNSPTKQCQQGSPIRTQILYLRIRSYQRRRFSCTASCWPFSALQPFSISESFWQYVWTVILPSKVLHLNGLPFRNQKREQQDLNYYFFKFFGAFWK